ncbi:YkgJ family cysteine cluster protein [Acidovorax sp.]|uniref:YkgJ family cysteine cluster protein n=1 Tax=Acidovorax sp. TaxID=1872122 RepID=UPI004037A52E
MTSPPNPALTEAEQAAFLQSIARVRSAAGRALRAVQAHAMQGAAAHGTDTNAATQAAEATEPAAQAAVDFIAQLHKGLDTVAEQARATGPQPACQAGCAHCCHLRVEATDPEVLHIAQHLQTLPSADQATTLLRLQQHVAAASAGTTRQPCSFLVNDRCAIYSVRPAACRKAHSLSAAHCAEQSPTIPQNLRLLVDAEALMAGTALAYRDQPLPASAHELNAAVLAALDGTPLHAPSALLRWYRGDEGALALPTTLP